MSEKLTHAYANKIRATYEANLSFFEEKLPAMFQIITTESAGVRVGAEVDENALISFSLDGHPLPLATLLAQSEDSMKNFDTPNRPEVVIRSPASLPTKGERFDTIDDPYLRDYYFSHHDFKARFAIDNAYTSRTGREEATASPDFGKGNVPILIVFGSGYGSHLIELLDRYFVRHLIVVDNDPGITRLSLGFTDYIAIYNNHLVRRGTKFTFLCSRDAETLASEIQQEIRGHWPPFFIHGIAIFRNLRNIELCNEVEKLLGRDLWLHYRGWGFFDDELMSVWHSLVNFNKGRPLLKVDQPVDPNAVAFVVANGPSLDKLTDLLRAHQDKAVIVSCGTALSALHRLGIAPDFHVEVERPYTTVETLRGSVPEEFRARLRLVGPTVLHPEAFEGVAEGFLFAKEGDSVTALLPDGHDRVASFPTVSNGAVSMLVKMGFRHIYLFGVDLGAHDPSQHHSSHSAYFRQEEFSGNLKTTLQYAASASESMGMNAEGNFGGTVSTNDIFTLARSAMEGALRRRQQEQNVYNLNDGAKIDGAEPMKPEDFRLPDETQNKAAVIDSMRGCFAHPKDFDAAKLREGWIASLEGVVKALKPEVNLKVGDKLTLIEKLARVNTAVDRSFAEHGAAYWSLRGSIAHMQRRIYEYATFIRDESVAIDFASDAFAAIDRFLDAALDAARSLDIAATRPPLTPIERGEAGAALESNLPGA